MMTEETPTVVLVHGAASASWNGVIGKLRAMSLDCVAVANPLQSTPRSELAFVQERQAVPTDRDPHEPPIDVSIKVRKSARAPMIGVDVRHLADPVGIPAQAHTSRGYRDFSG